MGVFGAQGFRGFGVWGFWVKGVGSAQNGHNFLCGSFMGLNPKPYFSGQGWVLGYLKSNIRESDPGEDFQSRSRLRVPSKP